MIRTAYPIRREIYSQLPGPMHHYSMTGEARLIPVS